MSEQGARRYHHGDLRRALLSAAEAELEAHGMEEFSLRRVAKRADVSHAAPAHHFGDVAGILTALAAVGFEELVATQARRQEGICGGRAALVAAGLGYVDFALARPALFHLMFASRRPVRADPVLARAGTIAFDKLRHDVAAAVTEASSGAREAGEVDVLAAWAAVHGLADLILGGNPGLRRILAEPGRDAAVAELVERAIPLDRTLASPAVPDHELQEGP